MSMVTRRLDQSAPPSEVHGPVVAFAGGSLSFAATQQRDGDAAVPLDEQLGLLGAALNRRSALSPGVRLDAYAVEVARALAHDDRKTAARSAGPAELPRLIWGA
jgi:hypothetical protein